MENCGVFGRDLAKIMGNIIQRGRGMQGYTRFVCETCGLDFMLDLHYEHKALRRFEPPDDIYLWCLCPRCDKPDAKAQGRWKDEDSTGVRLESAQEES